MAATAGAGDLKLGPLDRAGYGPFYIARDRASSRTRASTSSSTIMADTPIKMGALMAGRDGAIVASTVAPSSP